MHAFLPPSGAASWVHCHAWPHMNQRYPSEDSQESREGTAAHWCFEELFQNRLPVIGSATPNGELVTKEMLDGGRLFVSTVDDDLAKLQLNRSVLLVEKPVAIPSVHEANWGTPDTRFGWKNSGIWVYDYKFGHKFVDALENYQCIDYVLGVADELQMNGADELTTPFHIVVVQPRNHDGIGPVRRWSGNVADLRAYRNKLQYSAQMAVAALMPGAPPPVATAGAHCYECPGRHSCGALQRSGYKALWLSQQSVPLELSDAALGQELKLLRQAAEVLEHRIGGLESDAKARLMRGAGVPGFMMESAMGREGWDRPAAQVIELGKLYGKELAKPPEAITPKQAIAMGMPSAVVSKMVKQETKGLRLVEDDGKRAAKAFGGKQ